MHHGVVDPFITEPFEIPWGSTVHFLVLIVPGYAKDLRHTYTLPDPWNVEVPGSIKSTGVFSGPTTEADYNECAGCD